MIRAIALLAAMSVPVLADHAPLPLPQFEPGGFDATELHTDATPAPFPKDKKPREAERVTKNCVDYLANFVHSIGKVNPFAEHMHDYEEPVRGGIIANKDHATTLIESHCGTN